MILRGFDVVRIGTRDDMCAGLSSTGKQSGFADERPCESTTTLEISGVSTEHHNVLLSALVQNKSHSNGRPQHSQEVLGYEKETIGCKITRPAVFVNYYYVVANPTFETIAMNMRGDCVRLSGGHRDGCHSSCNPRHVITFISPVVCRQAAAC